MFQLSGFDTRKETETQITEMVELEYSTARAWLLSFEYYTENLHVAILNQIVQYRLILKFYT